MFSISESFVVCVMGFLKLNCFKCVLYSLLGFDRVIAYALSEWLQDIKKNQQLSLLGGVGPMYSLVQLGECYLEYCHKCNL